MRLSSALLSLSAFLLLPHPIFAQAAADGRSPRPQSINTHDEYPRDIDDFLRRNAAVAGKLAQRPAVGVRKMSDEEGEKFWPDYWYFDDDFNDVQMNNTTEGENGLQKKEVETPDTWANSSEPLPFRPSFPLHTDERVGAPYLIGRYFPAPRDLLSPLVKRAFQCPAGTHNCASISRPNSCCSTGETCQLIQDAGLGDVGCCPQGETCSGSISSCDAGYSSCPNNTGGGCCIPGYECVNDGCVFVATVTVTIHPTVTVTSSRSTSSSRTSTPTTTLTTTTSTRTSASLVPPARPTSQSTVTTKDSTRTTTTSFSSGSICPTGFYACSAVYHGGCCRTGRDCDTTSCPITSSSTITSEGRTIVIPAETGASTLGHVTGLARCASGWFSCADTVGGGCCPTGFNCGTSCTATAGASVTGAVGKTQPQIGAGRVNGMDPMWRKIYLLGALYLGLLL